MPTEAELIVEVAQLREQLAVERRMRSYAEDELRRVRDQPPDATLVQAISTLQMERDQVAHRLNRVAGGLSDLRGNSNGKRKDELVHAIRALAAEADGEIVASVPPPVPTVESNTQRGDGNS